MTTGLILPNQLFEYSQHPVLLQKPATVIIYEHPLFFKSTFNVNKHYTLLAAMDHYRRNLNHPNIVYLDRHQPFPSCTWCVDPVDFDILKQLKSTKCLVLETPMFLATTRDLANYGEPTKYQTHFYKWQLARLGLFPDFKKTYDSSNRKPYDKNCPDRHVTYPPNKQIVEYVKTHFADSPGTIMYYQPCTRTQALKLLHDFDISSFRYQDAANSKMIFGPHSLLSLSLNIGLLQPAEVIRYICPTGKLSDHKNPAEVEGFVRQIVGWREYMRYLYLFKHGKWVVPVVYNVPTAYGNPTQKWSCDYDLVTVAMQKVEKYGYAHHIERLMYIGNYFVISGYPAEYVYDWFMTCVDAFPWVMEGNIYGMLYGWLNGTMKRPYVSTANYITKMSKEKMSNADKWHDLYVEFLRHHPELTKNYAFAAQYKKLCV